MDQVAGFGTERVALNDAGVALEDVARPADSTGHQTACANAQSPCRPLPAYGGVPSPLSPWFCARFREIALFFAPPQRRPYGAPCEPPPLVSSVRELQPQLLLSNEQSLRPTPIAHVDQAEGVAAVEPGWVAAGAVRSSGARAAAVQGSDGCPKDTEVASLTVGYTAAEIVVSARASAEEAARSAAQRGWRSLLARMYWLPE